VWNCKNPRDFYPSKMFCSICGNIQEIQRPKRKTRKNGHIKDLWCIRCKTETKHIENADILAMTV